MTVPSLRHRPFWMDLSMLLPIVPPALWWIWLLDAITAESYQSMNLVVASLFALTLAIAIVVGSSCTHPVLAAATAVASVVPFGLFWGFTQVAFNEDPHAFRVPVLALGALAIGAAASATGLVRAGLRRGPSAS